MVDPQRKINIVEFVEILRDHMSLSITQLLYFVTTIKLAEVGRLGSA